MGPRLFAGDIHPDRKPIESNTVVQPAARDRLDINRKGILRRAIEGATKR